MRVEFGPSMAAIKGSFAAIAAASFAGIIEIFGRGHTAALGPEEVTWALGYFLVSMPFALLSYIKFAEMEEGSRSIGPVELGIMLVALVSFLFGVLSIVGAMWEPGRYICSASFLACVFLLAWPKPKKEDPEA